MTSDVVTIGQAASCQEVARLMSDRADRAPHPAAAGGRRGGTLRGIVSRRDLLSVFRRPDDEIAADVEAALAAEPGDAAAVKLAAEVDGVVGVYDKLPA